MSGKVWEFFGFRSNDGSSEAQKYVASETCPIIREKCEKSFNDGTVSGVCTLKPMTSSPVICCPVRLYADDYQILKDVVYESFGENLELVPGKDAVAHAVSNEKSCVAVFGHRWGGELRLPQKSGSGGYFVDWVLAKLDMYGELVEFVAVEVQTIDTTGSYRKGYEALKSGRKLVKTTAGLNWENVAKRILPQLIYKGQVLQRESLCKKGLFFVCPKPVFERIMKRLGGQDKLVKYSLQPASLSFLVYDHDESKPNIDGSIVALRRTELHSTAVYKVQEAFNNVTLPDEDVYKAAIVSALSKGD